MRRTFDIDTNSIPILDADSDSDAETDSDVETDSDADSGFGR